MIVLLAALLLIITFFFYSFFKGDFLSPTLISSSLFLLFSFLYCVLYSYIQEDITAKTVIVIILTMFSIFVGEVVSRKINIKHITKTSVISSGIAKDIIFSKKVIIIWFIIMLITAIYRFYDLYQFSRTLGNSSIWSTTASVRLALVKGLYTGDVNHLNMITFLFTGMSEIVCYASIYYLTYRLVYFKIFDKMLLLPIVGYCLSLVSFTSRTDYIKLAIGFILVYMFLSMRKNGTVGISSKTITRLIRFGIFAVIFFFGYGYITRLGGGESDATNTSLANNIVAYAPAAILGLSRFLSNQIGLGFGKGFGTNGYFGYWTLQDLYTSFGITHVSVPQSNLKMFYYGNNVRSNIYTALVLPIQDYGMLASLIIKFFEGVFAGIVLKFFKQSKIMTNSGVILWVLYTQIYYCFFYFPIADRFMQYLSFSTLVKYTIFAYITIGFLFPYRTVNKLKVME